MGRPVQVVADSFGASDQSGRIAGAAGEIDAGDVAGGDASRGGDDFANAKAGDVTEIVDALIRVLEGAENEKVSLGEVVDMDVVTDASAVGGGIAGAKDMNWTRRTDQA